MAGTQNLCLKKDEVKNGPIFSNEGKVNESIIQDLKPMFNESDIIGLTTQFED